MGNQLSEINECFYYETEQLAYQHNPLDAVGYMRTVNGTLEIDNGKKTEFRYIKSRTELIEDCSLENK